MADSLQNNTLSRADLNNEFGNAKNIHYGDILVKLGDCVNVDSDELPFINDSTILNKNKESFLKNGDFVFADTAKDETTRK